MQHLVQRRDALGRTRTGDGEGRSPGCQRHGLRNGSGIQIRCEEEAGVSVSGGGGIHRADRKNAVGPGLAVTGDAGSVGAEGQDDNAGAESGEFFKLARSRRLAGQRFRFRFVDKEEVNIFIGAGFCRLVHGSGVEGNLEAALMRFPDEDICVIELILEEYQRTCGETLPDDAAFIGSNGLIRAAEEQNAVLSRGFHLNDGMPCDRMLIHDHAGGVNACPIQNIPQEESLRTDLSGVTGVKTRTGEGNGLV